MNFLIAEDNVSVRRMIRSLVAQPNDEVYECGDGSEALAAYLRLQPDWVLMDIEMPIMDGIAAVRAIHAADPQAKIIVVTGYEDSQMRLEAKEAGATAYILKDDLTRLRFVINEQRKF